MDETGLAKALSERRHLRVPRDEGVGERAELTRTKGCRRQPRRLVDDDDRVRFEAHVEGGVWVG